MTNVELLEGLKPHKNDLVVVPDTFIVPEGLPFLIHKIKYLLTPSIIRSGAGDMGFFENLSAKKILGWLTGMSENPENQKQNQESKSESQSQNLNSSVSGIDKPEPFFYRYSRPLDCKNEYCFGPKGGVTFYITLSAKTKKLAFSYSLCHNDDLFNKSTARHIAKQRFDNEDSYEIINYDPDLSAMTNIKYAIQMYLYGDTNGPKTTSLEGEPALPKFSLVSERINKYELNLIYERI